MFSQPTLDDFAAAIDWHLDKAAEAAERSYKAITHKRAAQGMLRSGATVIQVYEAAHANFAQGIEQALGELRRDAMNTSLDKTVMRRVTGERLMSFMERCKAATKPDQLLQFAPPGPVHERLVKFDAILTHTLRQFDVGFLVPPVPEVPPIMNTIITAGGNLSGVAVQQGATHSVQHAASDAANNVEGAISAIAELEQLVAASALSQQTLANIQGDIATIKAQLSKPSRSAAIVTETVRSLRSIVENVAGNALTPRALELVTDLGESLGLGVGIAVDCCLV